MVTAKVNTRKIVVDGERECVLHLENVLRRFVGVDRGCWTREQSLQCLGPLLPRWQARSVTARLEGSPLPPVSDGERPEEEKRLERCSRQLHRGERAARRQDSPLPPVSDGKRPEEEEKGN